MAIVAPLVTHYSLVGKEGYELSVPKWPELAATSVNEGTDLANTSVTPTNAELTAAEAGIMLTITDLLSKSDIIGEVTTNGQWAQACGRAIQDHVEKALTALFPSFDSEVGTSGTDITLANYLAAIYYLDAYNARGSRSCILHPVQYMHLRTALADASGVIYGGKEEFSRTGQVDRLFGVDVYQTTNV